MRTLIFDSTLTGHHLEYLHHIYMGAYERPAEEFIFAVPEKEWLSIKEKREWPSATNISFVFLNDEECANLLTGGKMKQCLKLSKMIRRVAIDARVDRIILIALAGAIPFLPLILPRRIKLSGIIYKIYLRASNSRLKLFEDKVRYTIMAHANTMGKVFILNDPRSAAKLNKIYHTDRFVSLPDPVPDVDRSVLRDLRKELNIPADNNVFLHFGAMDGRKGTLEILEAILLMNPEELRGKTFLFAGRVLNDIKEDFYRLKQECEAAGSHIIVYDEFVDYDLLNNLCHTCDCILIPYKLTDLSSGALGYAAIFGKPVIGPASGLIGDLIKDNCLGETLCSITAENLKNAILGYAPHRINTSYRLANTVEAFSSIILI